MKRWGVSIGGGLLGLSLAFFSLRRALPFTDSGDSGQAMGAAIPLLGAAIGLILVAVVLARPVADWIGEGAASLLYSRRRFDSPQPAYGVPEGFAIRGQVEEALRLYREIAAEYPQELRAWTESLELTWSVLGDAERTRLLCEEGRRLLSRDEDRRRLAEFHEALRAGKLPHRWPHLRGRFPRGG